MLTLLASKDEKAWHGYVSQLPSDRQDVHFLPEMMAPYEACESGTGSLLVTEDDKGFIIQPILKCKDGVTRHPYNFGGPVSNYDGGTCLNSFECTLNPFILDHQSLLVGDRCEYVKNTVWVDLLTITPFRPTTRHIVAKAERGGLSMCEVVPSNGEVALFCSMYSETMVRNNAADHWRLPDKWFHTFFDALGNLASLHFVFSGKYPNYTPVAGCILLHAYGTCYYHFAASWGDTPTFGANHFMAAKAIGWAREKGFKRFHLGGGVQPKDGLFTFKSGFSELTLPIYRLKQEVACAV